MTEWVAYLGNYPSGEEALDMRFQWLLAHIIHSDNQTRYTLQKVMTGKGKQPQMPDLKKFQIFRRIGQEAAARGLRGQTQEQINRTMRSWGLALGVKPK